jgi:16S rRNA (cytosine967-C5)-methyltransferase
VSAGSATAFPQPANHGRAGLNSRLAAVAILGLIVDGRRSLDSLLDPENGLASWRALSARDRALARAIVLSALRHRRRIEHAFSVVLDRNPPRKAAYLRNTLHVAAAQILFLEVPDSAAVNLAVTALLADRRSERFANMANAVLRRLSREKTELLRRQADWRLSFPDWLARRIASDYGRERAAAIAAMTAMRPNLDLTLSPRICDQRRAELTRLLDAFILPTGSVRLRHETPVVELPDYADGEWWVQDAAAAMPALMFGDVSGLAVADLCAAPGGKTAQLAALGARVTAVDSNPARLGLLRRNMERLRLEAEIFEADLFEWRPDNPFDAILLDAPCSATGTIRRHPDVMWVRSEEEIGKLAGLQRRMIARAITFLRPGGILVYANCSMLKEEGEHLLAEVTRELPLEIAPLRPGEIPGAEGLINGQGALRTLPNDFPQPDPTRGGLDGFFAARFRLQ